MLSLQRKMKIVLQFLSELAQNNNREWFTANKDRYLACYQRVADFTQEYIAAMTQIDSRLGVLTPRDCMWRIYRDVRFSKNKSPYKEWFGSFLAVNGGKKSVHAGYYIHFQPNNCMFAGGMWCPEPDLLKRLRQDIYDNYEEIENIFADKHFKKYFRDFDTDYMLKTVPAGFNKDFCHADWLKRKSFSVSVHLPDETVCAPDFLHTLMDISRAATPINNFLNYTLDGEEDD